jgi:predicted MPP superfamily phosphohydrolase
MGNHDYADYGPHDKEERLGSIAKLKSLQAQMGFQMLDNSHVLWEKEGDAMVLAGVENWGRGFRQSGDLSQALQGSDAANRFTVLMSHDPTHFESMVMDNKAPVELTLSGHTHGMQLGIEIPWLGIQWSPSSFRYKRWGGLYLEGKQYLHVNRGFGVLGFPGRVGMPPEITVLTLVQGEARA